MKQPNNRVRPVPKVPDVPLDQVYKVFDQAITAFFEIHEENDTPDRVKELRSQAIFDLLPTIFYFCKQGYRFDIIMSILQKKLDFIKEAKTKAEIKDILAVARPHYNYAEIVPYTPKYHVEEEELLLWFEIVTKSPLRPEAYKRIGYLWKRIMPPEYWDMAKGM